MVTTIQRLVWSGAVGLGLLLGACATPSNGPAPPPIMEPGIGGAGQAGIPGEHIPDGSGTPQDQARSPEPSQPSATPPEPPESPPGPPPPGPPRAARPDVVKSPAGGFDDTPLGERRSGEDAGPANIHVLED